MRQYFSGHPRYGAHQQHTHRPHPQATPVPPFQRQFKHPSYLDIKPQITPPPRPEKRPPHIGSYIFISLLLLVGIICSCGYSHFFSPFQTQLAQFLRPLGKGNSIQNRPWNFLLLGSDNDAKYTFPNVLTQVVMVVRVDPEAHRVTMVSIPRDSWVWIPGAGGMHKLDQAFYLGTQHGKQFEDGVRMVKQTIEEDYGIKIDRYGWIGLDGFSKLIDTMGGIDINVQHPIIDDTYPDDTNNQANDIHGYRRLYLAPGSQHLGGLEALEYVRSRHADLVGDIGRNQRQQQVLEALRARLTLTSIASNYLDLLKDMEGKVYTDLSTQEVLDLANFARTLDEQRAVTHITLGISQGTSGYGTTQRLYDTLTNTEQDVILPLCEAIQPLFNRVFALGAGARSCNVQDRNGTPNIIITPDTTTPAPEATPDTTIDASATPNTDLTPTPSSLPITPTPSLTPDTGNQPNRSTPPDNNGLRQPNI